MNVQSLLNHGAQEDSSKVFESPKITIRRNGLLFGGTVIQISNITRVWTGLIPKKPFPWLVFILLLVVIVSAFSVGAWESGNPILIVPIFPAVLVVVYAGYRHHRSQVQFYAVNLELSSGRHFGFTSPDIKFIGKAFNVLTKIIMDAGNDNASYTLNFQDGKFYVGNETVVDTVASGGGNVEIGGNYTHEHSK